MTRTVLLVVHTGRVENLRTAERVAAGLLAAGLRPRVLRSEAPGLKLDEGGEAGAKAAKKIAEKIAQQAAQQGIEIIDAGPDIHPADGAEMVIGLGGDGTLLRAAELAHPTGVPVFGVNLGRIGFLTEVDEDELAEAVDAVARCRYQVDERMTIDVLASHNGTVLASTWALNEATVEKTTREKILEVVIEVDGRPVSDFGCDGVLCATPTGSTAYAFSAGGPVVWPTVEALLLVPSNAHALFARPLVVSPDSAIALEIVPDDHPAVLCCDGRRTFELPPGARVEVRRGRTPVRLVKLNTEPFTDRLVRKFSLPVQGWRGPRRGV